METAEKTIVTIETVVNAPIEKVWEHWNSPESIKSWCFATEEWHAPAAENDLKEGGRFKTRMEAKDGSFGFDFGGAYTQVKTNERIEYVMDDGRKVQITFETVPGGTKVVEKFEAEGTNSVDMQKAGWQAILDNFRKYTESK